MAPATVSPATVNPSVSASPVSTNRESKSRRHGDEATNKVLVTRMADEETEDGRIRNREAMAKIRDAWVYKQVRERVSEFTEYHQVSTSSVVWVAVCAHWYVFLFTLQTSF